MKNSFSQILSPGAIDVRSVISKSWFHCLLISLTAGLVRILLLGKPYPLSFDDGVYAMSIIHVERGLTPFKEVFSSQGPYFLTLMSLPAQLFGTSPAVLRFIPFISGIVLAVLTYFLSKRFVSKNWALAAGLLVATSGSVLRTTAPITSDGVIAVFILLSVLMAYRFIEKDTLLNGFYLGASIGVGCGIKSFFMIPTLVFVLIATRKTKFKNRIFSGIISVLFFLAPFPVFGVKKTIEQSILYHLGKDESLDLAGNFSKLITTMSSFDTFLLIFSILALVIGLTRLYSTIKNDAARKIVFQKFLDPSLPYLFILVLCLGTFVMIIFQTPLFRNHLTVFIVPLIISVVYVIQTLPKWNSNYALSFTAIFGLLTILSLQNVFSDPLIKVSNDLKDATALLKNLPSNSIILTNEPGVAFAANLDVPEGLEDTSRFRFLNKNEKLKLKRSDFEIILENDRTICAFVVSPLPISKEIQLNEIAPSHWTKTFDSGFQIWINPSDKCKK